MTVAIHSKETEKLFFFKLVSGELFRQVLDTSYSLINISSYRNFFYIFAKDPDGKFMLGEINF